MPQDRSTTAQEQRLLDALMQRARHGDAACLLFYDTAAQGCDRVSAACLSQWYPAPFTLEGQQYHHAEQYMMAEKARLFGDGAARQAILQTASPYKAKTLGRQVQGFEPTTWLAARFGIVLRGNQAKFRQNPPLAAFLLATGTQLLVEASPVDCIWGIGLAQEDRRARQPQHWPGLNLLGLALMEVRAALQR